MYSSPTRYRNMRAAKQHPPVILLLGRRTPTNRPVDEWLAASRYCVSEATDVFQALEQLSDFTLRDRPDVVFLHVDSDTSDLEFIQTLIATAEGEPDVPVINFADGAMVQDESEFEKALAGLACQLDKFIPEHRSARA
jgi:hypothetical protein